MGGKGGRCVGKTTLSPSCYDCFEVLGLVYYFIVIWNTVATKQQGE